MQGASDLYQRAPRVFIEAVQHEILESTSPVVGDQGRITHLGRFAIGSPGKCSTVRSNKIPIDVTALVDPTAPRG